MVLTRREFGKGLLASLPLACAWPALGAAAKFSSKIDGVQIAAITYCYRDMRDPKVPWSPAKVDHMMDQLVQAYIDDRINVAEFWIGYIEPVAFNPLAPGSPQIREQLRQWRLSRPLDIFERARKKFDDAGIEIYSCMYNFDDKITDEEIEVGFEIAKALKTNVVSAGCTLPSIKRVASFAEKHKMRVGVHTESPFNDPHPEIDGMGVTANILSAMKLSPYVDVTLDVGHYTAAGGDSIAFMKAHHDRIVALHIQDRFKNDPRPHDCQNDLEWGQAQTPIREIFRLMKQEKYTFPAIIEYNYCGKGTPVEEVRKCYEYAKAALA